MGNYIDKSEIDTWPSGTTDEEKDAIIARIELQLEKYTDTVFYAKDFDIRLNGNDKNRLFLPLDGDIISITDIIICGFELPESWIDFGADSVFLNVCESGSWASAEYYYRLTLSTYAGIFPRGYNNIRVIGTYGSTGLLSLAKKACEIMVTYENEFGGATPTYKAKMKSEKIGDYSYTRDSSQYGRIYTGIPEADRIIDLLVRDKPILMTP